MSNITLDGLPLKTGTVSDAGIVHYRESGVDKKLTISDLIAKFLANNPKLSSIEALSSIANLLSFANLNGSADKSFYFDGVGSLVLADRLGTTTNKGVVELLTDAELATGADTTRVPTASNLLSLFTASSLSAGTISSIVSNGTSFDKFHIRAKKQINTIPAGGAVQTITFASAFPNACLAVVVAPADWSGSNPAISQLFVTGKTATNFSISNTDADSNITAFEYIAIGY